MKMMVGFDDEKEMRDSVHAELFCSVAFVC